ncbi:DsrE family protein [Rhodocytophaga aerolata]|uniref:DsrE family protein n=1 Tax=Rhodocytophaga aerolata TaxID=455078 RepID=A0ABT8RD55_9BACT|nr:DsrE family protein [Rhodocytophaga aerolata]MDO1449274.1 DsrE family protein [Rhodocytophaga aerolata]
MNLNKNISINLWVAILVLVSMTLLALVPKNNSVPTSEKQQRHRIVFQLSSADTLTQRGLLKNLQNLLTEWPDAQIEVVNHSQGLDFVLAKESLFSKEISGFIKKGVVFAACENTLKSRKLDKFALLPGITTVPSGVAEIVKKQEEGWSYLKAGN